MISVIVPVYNSEDSIKRCIESVLRQSYSDWELILIDDGSQDHSLKICKEYASNDERIKCISKENGGASSARNKGLEQSSGEYVAFLDSDDTMEYDMLEDLLHDIIKTNADISICGMKRINGDYITHQTEDANIFDGNKEVADFINRYYVKWLVSSPGGRLYKRRIISENRFDTSYVIAEDLKFNLQYYSKINKISIISEALYCYYNNDCSLTNTYHKEDYECIKNTNRMAKAILLRRGFGEETNIDNINYKLFEYSRYCIIENNGIADRAEQKKYVENIVNDIDLCIALDKLPKLSFSKSIYFQLLRAKKIGLIYLITKLVWIKRNKNILGYIYVKNRVCKKEC